ncbi:MAG: M24 family metallopeptidase [Steroidobacteraceae bacterium]
MLDADPLQDIRNTNSVRYTMVNGRLYEALGMDEIRQPRRAPGQFCRTGRLPRHRLERVLGGALNHAGTRAGRSRRPQYDREMIPRCGHDAPRDTPTYADPARHAQWRWAWRVRRSRRRSCCVAGTASTCVSRPNTLKPFGAPSRPGVVLQEADIYFPIDIGPVWRSWEGDGGETFVVGQDADMLRIARDVRRLFDDARAAWRSQGLTGAALYQYAGSRAADMGWQLNLAMNGHRLADFPHAAVHKGSLADARFVPSPELWVLEIQIRHPARPFSAFYEDLLVDDEWR